ncbi:hypothetical protein WJX72_010792 [[Myrmecia] bisecta]|uniref:Major facilitator superfamily (MFS) profile domain-containing protein n=1 Tax=[Myrmecia] bisecta TaxID=41462 RepID=A0AAW1PEW6_9CHLO
MYIYRYIDAGIPAEDAERQSRAIQNVAGRLEPSGRDQRPLEARRVLEVDGEPAQELVVAFRSHTDSASSDISPLAKGRELHDEAEEEGQPWEDLPRSERCRITYREDLQEQAAEARAVWNLFKQDPLEPVRRYFSEYVMPGIGLFLEGYVIFSISNNSTLFKQAYPKCWSTFEDCNETWTEATTYLQLIGILMGQLFFGVMGDWVGRRAAMLLDMSIILAGVILLTASNGPTINGWVICYAWAQWLFGFGIGGEYPMSATRATEESAEHRRYQQRHRGRKVMLAYTMQGWGQFINLSVLILLLLIFNSSGNPPYSSAAAGATWRVTFAVLIPLVLYLIYYRVYVLKELTVLSKAKKKAGVEGYDWKSLRLLFTCFGHRLVGTAGIWFCNDWYFYGNGVFRSTFVGILVGPKAGVLTNWLYSWINAGVQLVGYYGASLSVDYRWLGRKRLTAFSFFMVAAIFAFVAGFYDQLIKKPNIHVFQFLYYFSSFWALYGSHTTSFLLAAESYPSQIRGTAHGISAATGKVGSILVVVWLNYLGNHNKFWITWPFALLGSLLATVFIADNTGLDLAELERRWDYIRAGRAQDYHGLAVHPRHLSLWERHVLHINRQYDLQLNKKMRAQERAEMRRVAQQAEAGNP